MTHTFAILEVSASAFAEIRGKLVNAGYRHSLLRDYGRELVDMHGIAIGERPRARSEPETLDDRLRHVEGELRASFDAQAAAGWPSPVATSLATRVHEANATADHLQEELYNAVVEACGNTPSDESEIRTDQYDNSIEVWGVGAIDLDQVAAALKAHGFERVWLHLHTDRGTCGCPCR